MALRLPLKKKDKYAIFDQLLPQDLLKFGLIPEFVGRLPIVTTLRELDRESLIKIITEPKKLTSKAIQKLFKYDNVELDFEKRSIGVNSRQSNRKKNRS